VLPCLSCKEQVSPDEAKVFAEVFLCPKCYRIAERLYRKGESELRMMLLILKESIRVAALKGELQFSFEKLDEMKREDLLSSLAKLADETRERTWEKPIQGQTPSRARTQQPALTVGGKPSSG